MIKSHILGYTIEVEGCVTAAACFFSLQFEDGGLPQDPRSHKWLFVVERNARVITPICSMLEYVHDIYILIYQHFSKQ